MNTIPTLHNRLTALTATTARILAARNAEIARLRQERALLATIATEAAIYAHGMGDPAALCAALDAYRAWQRVGEVRA